MIIVSGRQVREVSDDIIAVIDKHNVPPQVFVRAGQLVRTREDENGQPFIDAAR